MRFFSPLNNTGSLSSLRFWLPLLLMNMWLLLDFRRVIFPDPVILNRFAAVLLVLIFGIFLSLAGSRLGAQDHRHEPSVEARGLVNLRNSRQNLRERDHLPLPNFGMRDLACTELAGYLNLVAFRKKLLRLSQEGVQVAPGRAGAHFDALHVLLDLLIFLRLLLGLVLVLAEIDDFADRRLGTRRHHHQVKSRFSRQVQRLTTLKDANLAAVRTDDANVTETKDTLVDRGPLITLRGSAEPVYVRAPRIKIVWIILS